MIVQTAGGEAEEVEEEESATEGGRVAATGARTGNAAATRERETVRERRDVLITSIDVHLQ